MNQYQSILKSLFEDLFNPEKGIEAITSYFSPQYTQWVDGKLLDFDAFIQHVKALKEVIATANVEFKEYLENGNTVADIHEVFLTKKTGEKLHVRVMAFFTFENQQILATRELTHLLSGDEADQDIGSRLA